MFYCIYLQDKQLRNKKVWLKTRPINVPAQYIVPDDMTLITDTVYWLSVSVVFEVMRDNKLTLTLWNVQLGTVCIPWSRLKNICLLSLFIYVYDIIERSFTDLVINSNLRYLSGFHAHSCTGHATQPIRASLSCDTYCVYSKTKRVESMGAFSMVMTLVSLVQSARTYMFVCCGTVCLETRGSVYRRRLRNFRSRERHVQRKPTTKLIVDADIKELRHPASLAETKYLPFGDVRIVEKHEKEQVLAGMKICVCTAYTVLMQVCNLYMMPLEVS